MWRERERETKRIALSSTRVCMENARDTLPVSTGQRQHRLPGGCVFSVSLLRGAREARARVKPNLLFLSVLALAPTGFDHHLLLLQGSNSAHTPVADFLSSSYLPPGVATAAAAAPGATTKTATSNVSGRALRLRRAVCEIIPGSGCRACAERRARECRR